MYNYHNYAAFGRKFFTGRLKLPFGQIQLIGSVRPKYDVWPNRWSNLNLLLKPILENSFDVLPLSGTWADVTVSDAILENPGYQLFRLFSLIALEAHDLAVKHKFDIDPFCSLVEPRMIYFHGVFSFDQWRIRMLSLLWKCSRQIKRQDMTKSLLASFSSAYHSIMNTSSYHRAFARAWKIAEVTPVHKSGDWENPSNNHPFSL